MDRWCLFIKFGIGIFHDQELKLHWFAVHEGTWGSCRLFVFGLQRLLTDKFEYDIKLLS